MVALEDCTIMVTIVPINRKSSTEKNPMLVYSLRNDRISGLLCKSGTEFFRKSSPINKNAKPIMNSPQDRRLLLPEKMNGIDNPMRGRAKRLMLTLNPKMEMIQAVTVVPTLAPMITVMDWVRDRSPALTKLTTITVVADDDWIRAVISTPVSTPVTRLVVIAVSMLLNRSPATFCNPSLMTFIPYKKSPKEPIRVKKSKKVYSISISLFDLLFYTRLLDIFGK